MTGKLIEFPHDPGEGRISLAKAQEMVKTLSGKLGKLRNQESLEVVDLGERIYGLEVESLLKFPGKFKELHDEINREIDEIAARQNS